MSTSRSKRHDHDRQKHRIHCSFEYTNPITHGARSKGHTDMPSLPRNESPLLTPWHLGQSKVCPRPASLYFDVFIQCTCRVFFQKEKAFQCEKYLSMASFLSEKLQTATSLSLWAALVIVSENNGDRWTMTSAPLRISVFCMLTQWARWGITYGTPGVCMYFVILP